MRDLEPARRRIDALLESRRPSDALGVVGGLDGLCRTVSEDLCLIGATVSLMPDVGTHAVCATSSSRARRLDDAQFDVGEGPAREAFAARRPVLAPQLEGTHAMRWPGWVTAALAEGVTGVYSFPLHVGAAIFGVLTLYSGRAALDRDELVTATTFAEVATALLLDGTITGENGVDGGLQPDLGAVLDGHAYVYQAQGMVMVTLGVSLAEARHRTTTSTSPSSP